MPNIAIDQEKCIGCGTCAVVCPAVFMMENMKAKTVPAADAGVSVQEAVDNCPVQAIVVSPSE